MCWIGWSAVSEQRTKATTRNCSGEWAWEPSALCVSGCHCERFQPPTAFLAFSSHHSVNAKCVLYPSRVLQIYVWSQRAIIATFLTMEVPLGSCFCLWHLTALSFFLSFFLFLSLIVNHVKCQLSSSVVSCLPDTDLFFSKRFLALSSPSSIQPFYSKWSTILVWYRPYSKDIRNRSRNSLFCQNKITQIQSAVGWSSWLWQKECGAIIKINNSRFCISLNSCNFLLKLMY